MRDSHLKLQTTLHAICFSLPLTSIPRIHASTYRQKSHQLNDDGNALTIPVVVSSD